MGLQDVVVRGLMTKITPYLEYICFYVLYPGGFIFSVAQYLYEYFFNWLIRQHRTRGNQVERAEDWENPNIIGRNRRRAHAKGGESSSLLMLTGSCGEPDMMNLWHFTLVGSPSECPDDWMEEAYSILGNSVKWDTVALPNHWQLQGYDVPLYTNTTYPFEFDPPRARRNGMWSDAACDLGLNSATSKVFPAKLHPSEPGENATGLYRRKFTLRDLCCSSAAAAGAGAGAAAGAAQRDNAAEAGARFFLVFEGVDACLTVWLDGQYVGYSQDSCLPAEFEVTTICRAKSVSGGCDFATAEHTLAVQVSRWCDGSYLEDQDKWWLSGIYREVYIERRPAAFVSDFEFSSTVRMRESVPRPLDNGYVTPGRSVLSADVIVSVLAEGVRTTTAAAGAGAGAGLEAGTDTPSRQPPPAHAVRVELWQAASYARASANASARARAAARPEVVLVKEFIPGEDLPNRVAADSIYADRRGFGEKTVPVLHAGVATVKATMSEPLLWTAETPHLYTLKITLFRTLQDASDGRDPLHEVTHQVGLRKVSIGGPDNLLRINDAPVVVAGINRHEFSPRTGRAVSKESMRADAVLLKKLNFNAVRSAHYPQHPYWLQVCDEVGLYVIDEANIETHGFQVLGQPVGYLSNLPEWELAMTARVTRMVERDKNHACVIGWSLGNESGHGRTHDHMAHWLRLRDPGRFVQYESGGARTAATDVICPMYTRPVWCEEQSLRDTKKRPVVLCEYAHAMGNSGGCLASYWQLFRDPKFPRVQGGFIWDFVDQGLLLPGDVVGYGYGGDFGDLPNTKQFCCNGIASPARALFPAAFEAAHLQSPVEVTLVFDATHHPVLIVTNRRSFADLSDVRLSIRPCLHSGEVNRYTLGRPFEFNVGPIVAGSFRKFDVMEQLRQSLNFSASSGPDAGSSAGTGVSFGATHAHMFGLSEAWLDVSAVSHPGLHGGALDEAFEVMHTAFTNPTLKSAFQRLSHTSSAVSPLPPMVLPHRTPGWGASDTNTSSHPHSCTTSATSSPFSQLGRGAQRRYSREGHEGSEEASSSIHHHDPHYLLEMTVQVSEQVDVSRGLFIRWSDGSVANIGRVCGRLVSWTDRNGHELIVEPVDACFFRAGTDNDRGGMQLSYHARWKEVGLDRLVRRSQRNSVISRRCLSSGAVMVTTAWVLESPRDAAIRVSFQCEARYTFDPCGTIDVAFSATASPNTPPLARCGLRWAISERLSEVKYFGLGPHEAYDDRLASAYLGVFETSVQAMHTHYTVPQECGRRADPRWVIFKGSEGDGLVVVPLAEDPYDHHHDRHGHSPRSPSLDAMSSDNSSVHASVSQAVNPVHGWGFSASLHSLEDLEQATHDHELLPSNSSSTRSDGRVHVHFDSRTMGLGGYDSWSPNVDEAFLVLPQLPPPSLRQATMPSYIAPKATRTPQKPLHLELRFIPWPDA